MFLLILFLLGGEEPFHFCETSKSGDRLVEAAGKLDPLLRGRSSESGGAPC